MTTIDVRPEVARFALLMEAKLRKHDDRPGWEELTQGYLLKRLHEEVAELESELIQGADPEIVKAEAADVGNFAMFIVDVVCLEHGSYDMNGVVLDSCQVERNLAECTEQLMRLPEPPTEMGDGPQERVDYALGLIAIGNQSTRFLHEG